MFIFSYLIGIYSYFIFFLSVLGLLTKDNVILVTVVWVFVLFYFEKKILLEVFNWISTKRFSLAIVKRNKLLSVLVGLIVFQAIVNLIGALGPELAFDALWYHLTLPKLYLLQHSVFHISGGLLYYSDMPKVGEMLYTGALALGNEITAKLVHYLFGLLVCVALYKISRKFLSPLMSMMAVAIFYSNLVVAWESTTAYIDLIRTFFETMALWGFINWYETEKKKWLIISAAMIGLAIATKLLAVGTLGIFVFGITWLLLQKRKKISVLVSNIVSYCFVALLIPLPWFIFAFVNTGNPLYPLFSPIFSSVHEKVFSLVLLSPLHFIATLWTNFTQASDPISPFYLISLPVLILSYKHMPKIIKLIFWFVILGILVWYLTSQVEGTRILMSYLPAFSLVIAWLIDYYKKKKYFYKTLLFLVILIASVSILYRGLATIKYMPVVFGKESRQTFLTNHLNFSFGDFYDTDDYFANNIKRNDRVLLYGFHNLYYIDFPFIDDSWIQKEETFNYVAVQNSSLPARFKDWQLVYKNDKTLVQLYRPPKRVCHKLCVY